MPAQAAVQGPGPVQAPAVFTPHSRAELQRRLLLTVLMLIIQY